ncbi:hypothetical protein ETF27_03350 [Prevotella brunnea]|uniref:Uncharacterized protein n=1 Tax=Prevotella brunnea TaxID=2508867 RepID=A0A5C8GKR8_9BACT|nr:hypothetical protein [Prevotella brunnea]MDR0185239.1 hypothetical protein [Prevotella brunnea]TXJ62720.1 hypothetical protein ETF27_03350 [Prevotella brunnea]
MEKESQRIRAKRKLIKVTFPNGKTFCHKNCTATMIAVLNEIGDENFPKIQMELCHLPLLSKEIYPKYKEWMKPLCNGWYVNTQANTDCKYIQLRAINEQLSLGLTIEIGTDFEAQDAPNKEKRSRKKEKLLVKFPNGIYVCNGNTQEIYLETIRRIGIEDIMRKQLKWGNRALITTSKVWNDQIEIAERRWIVVPNTTKDKTKMLRIIGAILHTNLEISIV